MIYPGKFGEDGFDDKPRSDKPRNEKRAQLLNAIAFVFCLVFIAATFFLVQSIKHGVRYEDCHMAGFHNCHMQFRRIPEGELHRLP